MSASLVGSEMCIRDSPCSAPAPTRRLRRCSPAEPVSWRPGRAPQRRPARRPRRTCQSGYRASRP
eukprot:10397123-Alexandrium_andersonii.AAC.1